jgi:hypothetical protein
MFGTYLDADPLDKADSAVFLEEGYTGLVCGNPNLKPTIHIKVTRKRLCHGRYKTG